MLVPGSSYSRGLELEVFEKLGIGQSVCTYKSIYTFINIYLVRRCGGGGYDMFIQKPLSTHSIVERAGCQETRPDTIHSGSLQFTYLRFRVFGG